MSLPYPFPRHFSNKENTPRVPSHPFDIDFSSTPNVPARTSKPRVSGMGRAPRGQKRHQEKPYTRVTSIHRAKIKANAAVTRSRRTRNKPPPLKLATGSLGGVEEIEIDIVTPTKMECPTRLVRSGCLPVDVGTPTIAGAKPGFVRPETGKVRLPPLPPLSIPFAVSTLPPPRLAPRAETMLPSEPTTVGLEKVFQVMPSELIKPAIPPVLTVELSDGVGIPIDYILKHLSPYFTEMASLHRHFVPAPLLTRQAPDRVDTPLFPSCSGPRARIDDMYDSLPYWFDGAATHDGLNDQIQAKLGSWGPNAVLAVRQLGAISSEPMLIPVNQIVLAASCSYYKYLCQIGTKLRGQGKASTGTTPIRQELARARAEGSAAMRAASMRLSGHAQTTSTPTSPSASVPRSVSSPTASRPISRLPMSPSKATSTRRLVTQPVPVIVIPTLGRNKENVSPTPSPSSSSPPTSPTSTSAHPFFNCATTVSLDPSQPPSDPQALFALKHLRLVPIYLPHAASFRLLLSFLHQPTTTPLLALLNIRPKTPSTRHIVEQLRGLPLSQLTARIHFITGFARNLTALGVGSDLLWEGAGWAYALTFAAIRKQGAERCGTEGVHEERIVPGWIRPTAVRVMT